MYENDGPDANDAETPSGAASSSTSSAAPSRRRVLGMLSLPPIAAALAGCETSDDDLLEETPTDRGETAPLSEVVRLGESYAMEGVTYAGDDTQVRVTGRVHGADHHVRVEHGEDVRESYVVDGDGYVLDGDRCLAYPGVGAEPKDEAETPQPAGGNETGVSASSTAANETGTPAETTAKREGETPVESTAEPPPSAESPVSAEPPTSPEVVLDGTTTIDGREVRVFERPAAESEGPEEVTTYHVDAETSYLRRLETASVVVDYGSWGNVEPIDAPDMDCREPDIPMPAATPTDVPTGTATPTAVPNGSRPRMVTDAEYAADDSTDVGFTLTGPSTVFVAFDTVPGVAVDVSTVPESDVSATLDGGSEVDAVEALSFPESDSGTGRTELARGDWAVVVTGARGSGEATPAGSVSGAVVRLTVAII